MKAVILAGGLGVRLKPLTDVIPKPLLPLGSKSVLEIQIASLKRHGVEDVYLALNDKAQYIRAFLGDGSRYGVRLHYSVEKKQLGTCGPLSLLRKELDSPFIVMNGDILTKADFADVDAFSRRRPDALMTIVTKVITAPFRFGKIESVGDYVVGIQEKPDIEFEILAGIYRMTPRVLEYVPDDEYYGVDKLLQTLLAEKAPVLRYVLRDYWVDIGVVEDYERAKLDYDKVFDDDARPAG